LQLIVHR
ncbi:unnamed protein product, partial [Allacma fusca]